MTADTPKQAKARVTLQKLLSPDFIGGSSLGEAVSALRAEILALCAADPLDRPTQSERRARLRERVACVAGWNGRGSGVSANGTVDSFYPTYPPAETWVEWTRSNGTQYRTNGKDWQMYAQQNLLDIAGWPYLLTLADAEGSAAAWRAAGGK